MKLLSVILLLFISMNVFSQTTQPVRVCADTLKWTPSATIPNSFVSVLHGDPKSNGYFTLRIKIPAHTVVKPHTHPVDETATVISGSINIGKGTAVDSLHTQHMTAGCFYVNPAGMPHYGYTGDSDVIIQIAAIGPWVATPVEQTK